MPFKCKKKRAEWFKKRAKRNQEAIDKLKSVPCHDCGTIFPPYVMEFDHVPERGEKKFNISYATGARKITSPSVKEELKKCDIVCANCHKVRTWERRQ